MTYRLKRFLLASYQLHSLDQKAYPTPDLRQAAGKGVNIFPVSAYQEKVTIINNNNDDNDNPVCKRWRSSHCFVRPPAHAVTISQWVKQFVSYGLVCCQKNNHYLTSMYGYPHIKTKKLSHFANWISIHELVFFLNGKLLVAKWWSVTPILLKAK